MSDTGSWRDHLAADNDELRLQGLRQLAREGHPEAQAIMLRCMGDLSWRVRKEAADQFLATQGALDHARQVIALLYDDENAGQRNTAAEVLIRLGREVIPDLLAEIDCRDHDVRKFLVDIFGAIGGDEAIRPLIARLQDEDINVAAAAAENLGRLHAREAVPFLLDALETDDLMFRFALLEALAQIGEEIPATRLLRFKDDAVLRKALYDCLGHVAGSEVVPVLQQAVIETHGAVAAAALKAMALIGERLGTETVRSICLLGQGGLLEAAGGHLGDRDQEARLAALSILGWCDDGSHADLLLPLLLDPELRETAYASLVHVCRKNPCQLLAEWDSQPEEVKACMALVFGEGNCIQSRQLLERAVVESVGDLQLAAATALTSIGNAESLQSLVDACRSADPQDRFTLAGAAGRLGERFPVETVALVRDLLDDTDEELRVCAVEILSLIPGGGVGRTLAFSLKDPSSQVRSSALRALSGRLDEESRGAVLLALTDEDPEVRRLATELIGEQGGEGVLTPLQLALQDEDLWVRASAVAAIGRAFGHNAVPQLRSALGDPVGMVVIRALEMLVEIEGEGAGEDLLAALSHSDQEVVSTALQLLVGLHSWGKVGDQVRMLLNHPSWEVRSQAVRLLAEQHPAGWRELLLERLAGEGEDLVRNQIRDYLEMGDDI